MARPDARVSARREEFAGRRHRRGAAAGRVFLDGEGDRRPVRRPDPVCVVSVRDLLNHLCEGANWVGLCVEAGGAPDPDPTHGVDYAAGDVLVAYDMGTVRTLAAFEAAGDKPVELPFGTLPAPAFMGIATTDHFTHAWDLATATGQDADLDPELASRLLEGAKLVIADAFRGPEGSGVPFGAEQAAPAGSNAAARLAAFLGRAV